MNCFMCHVSLEKKSRSMYVKSANNLYCKRCYMITYKKHRNSLNNNSVENDDDLENIEDDDRMTVDTVDKQLAKVTLSFPQSLSSACSCTFFVL